MEKFKVYIDVLVTKLNKIIYHSEFLVNTGKRSCSLSLMNLILDNRKNKSLHCFSYKCALLLYTQDKKRIWAHLKC